MRYAATVEREGKFWLITVHGVGVTQALRVAEIPEMAAGLVRALTDVKDADVELNFKGKGLEDIQAVRLKRERAQQEMTEASDDMRVLIRTLHDQGVKQSDIATLLGISRQRASQLVNAATMRSGRSARSRPHAG